jgi:hypothetical protein
VAWSAQSVRRADLLLARGLRRSVDRDNDRASPLCLSAVGARARVRRKFRARAPARSVVEVVPAPQLRTGPFLLIRPVPVFEWSVKENMLAVPACVELSGARNPVVNPLTSLEVLGFKGTGINSLRVKRWFKGQVAQSFPAVLWTWTWTGSLPAQIATSGLRICGSQPRWNGEYGAGCYYCAQEERRYYRSLLAPTHSLGVAMWE